ncbi:toxin regulator [Romboutsia sp.]|uniref:toxin regulator n=1 Tax=Romboutsia sp. TaxID=1965302 RepID=UPI002C6BA014|nr:toxin regulator [Romboutsia sp.]HSQ87983.1 toxin regulator [Romboutsia sp.]
MKLKEKLKNMNKKTVAKIAGIFILGWIFGASSSPICSDADHVGLEDQVSEQQATIKADEKEIETLSAKVDQAEPFFKMKAEEQRQLEEEQKRVAEEKRLAEEKAKEEKRLAEEKAKKEEEERKLAEEKKGYDTGITYDQLARTPDDYLMKKVKFRGEVVQVMEGEGRTQIRLAVNGDYDHMILAEFSADKVKSRVLEDDNITIRGISAGLYTYQSTMGGNITIPSVLINQIDQ